MKFIEIKVGDLNSFVNSLEFKNMKELPISSLRAISQSHNPLAEPSDTALIYCKNEQNLVTGYIGILPARIYADEIQKVFFISCWWAHAESGRGVAMKLFYRMLEITQRKVLFFHLPERMAAILKATGNFTFPSETTGLKGFIKYNSVDWLKRRKPALSFLKPLAFLADLISNIPVSLKLSIAKSQLQRKCSLKAEVIDELKAEHLQFIQQICLNKTVFRLIEEINWTAANPWLSVDSTTFSNEAGKYRFSLLAKEWKTFWIEFKIKDEIKAMAYLSFRDGILAIPYIWFSIEDANELVSALSILLIEMKAKAFQVYQPVLAKAFNESKLFIHRRELKRIIAWPIEMDDIMNKNYLLQDGDGDAIFT